MFRYLLLAEVLEVGVVEVHEGVLEPSDPSGTLLNLNPIRNCTRNKLRFFFMFGSYLPTLHRLALSASLRVSMMV